MTARWDFKRTVPPHVDKDGSYAAIYGRGEDRMYVEVWYYQDNDDPRVHIWAFACKEKDLASSHWVSGRFQQIVRYAVAVPIDILNDIATEMTKRAKGA
jgi:hypothetical protein